MKLTTKGWCYEHKSNVTIINLIKDMCNKHNVDNKWVTSDQSDMDEYPYIMYDSEDSLTMTLDDTLRKIDLEDFITAIETYKVSSIRLNDDYVAKFDGENVIVGCLTFPKKVVLELAALIKKY